MAKLGKGSKVPDWVLGSGITLVFLVLFFIRPAFLETIELKTFDVRMRLFPPPPASEQVAIVAIDDESVAKLGRWPWPRARIAKIINFLKESQASVIGLSLIFSEPEENSGLVALDGLEKAFNEMGFGVKGAPFLEKVAALKADLNNDAKLVESTKAAGNVVLPMVFDFGGKATVGKGEEKLPPFVEQSALPVAVSEGGGGGPPRAVGVILPLESLGSAAAGMGHINKIPDPDGTTRWEPFLVDYAGANFPSFTLAVLAKFLKIPRDKIQVLGGRGIQLGSTLIPTDARMRFLIDYRPGDKLVPTYSFYDVLNGKVAPTAFKGKIVLLGATALGIGDIEPTPVASVFPGIQKHATVIDDVLQGAFVTRPGWADMAELLVVILIGAFSALVLPRLDARMGTLASGALFLLYLGAAIFLYKAQGVWISMTYAPLLLVVNYMAITSRRFRTTEFEKRVIEVESDEANKLLGLTFQGKGMLDLAWEKFSKIPVMEEMKGVLYNLALDFERKRQGSKALQCYDRIATVDGHFKDIETRMDKLKKLAASPQVAAPIGLKADATAMIEGIERPTLGRYEIVEELGRGAMGIVYKGVDPKINREVAIKTVHFDQVDEAMLQQVKERFFREAQSAGKLSHPNIMTIYDAGEEMDLAYIAMELLKGKDLEGWCQKGKLLAPERVLDHVAKVADALHYAHEHGVVHRDIKPANIMLLETAEIKVTDFGIARVQSSTQTKTGMVVGTPAYMSPEQITGEGVDGRSDLFSLGVVLYEMLTGERPFQGESIATIMFQITRGDPPPLARHNPDVPPVCQPILDRALAKDKEQRFQTGAEFAAACRQALEQIKGATAAR